ncbi:MAG TPA: endo-1,4-beta-xylanase [bacterium]|nr:endo-1,4-beta-xylanase [bacterium]HPR88896.1 endo-1,4-beta-xylanase [bacterium]
MTPLSRRDFLRTGGLGAAAVLSGAFSGPGALFAKPPGDLLFRPYPHPWMPEFTSAYLADEREDPFVSALRVDRDGVVIPAGASKSRFSVNARWYVEGFGYLYLAADNGGDYYAPEDSGRYNLNHEFARSRVLRNRAVRRRYEQGGCRFSAEVTHLTALSEELLEDSHRKAADGEAAAQLADRSLYYALHAGERMELEKARHDIARAARSEPFWFGCETRQFIWIKHEEFIQRFKELFNFATVTHYIWDSWYEHFEPEEGAYNWGVKEDIVRWLEEEQITIQGRPLFWFHPIVTPDWLKNKNLDQLKRYVEKHTRDVVGHYGDRVRQWEVVNEYHDWANIHNHTPEETVEIVRLACDTTRAVNPRVVRILNNCAPWAEYAAWGHMARQKEPAGRPLRSPHRFIQDLVEAGVEFDVLGIQVYFPHRDLSDIVRMLERFEQFGKPIYITELGATSGPSAEMVASGKMTLPAEPYEWHRPWDEELQADWLEQVYTLYYSRPAIRAVNWYDFADFRTHILNGGLIREDGSPKRSYTRLETLLQSWNRRPHSERTGQ